MESEKDPVISNDISDGLRTSRRTAVLYSSLLSPSWDSRCPSRKRSLVMESGRCWNLPPPRGIPAQKSWSLGSTLTTVSNSLTPPSHWGCPYGWTLERPPLSLPSVLSALVLTTFLCWCGLHGTVLNQILAKTLNSLVPQVIPTTSLLVQISRSSGSHPPGTLCPILSPFLLVKERQGSENLSCTPRGPPSA